MYYASETAAPFQPTLSMTLRGHRHGVRSVAFQPAAPSSSVTPNVISGGMDGAVMLWDPTGAARAVRFTGHRGPVLSVAQSSRPHLFASGGQDGYVRIWIPSERRTSATINAYPEGRATNSACEWRAHTGATRGVAFAKDGSDRLYSIGDDKAVKTWDLNVLSSTGHHHARRMTNKFAGSFTASPTTAYAASGHTSRITALAVQRPLVSSQYCHCVASGGDDGVVFVWDTRSRTAAHVLYGDADHCGGVLALSFHPDGRVLASGDEAGNLNLFDLRRTSSSSNGVATSSYSLLQHYHAAHADAGGVGTAGVDFAPNGGWLLSCGDDGTTKLWDVKEGHLYCTVQAHDGPVASCRFSDDGAWFVTGGGIDKTVLIWRSGLAASCAARAMASVPTAASTCTTTTPESSSLLSAGSPGRRAAELPQPLQQQCVSATYTASSPSKMTAMSDRARGGSRAVEANSPSRMGSRSSSTIERQVAPPRRPPIPLAPQSGSTSALVAVDALPARQLADVRANDSALSQHQQCHNDPGTSENTPRERSFERCEERYSHLVTPPPDRAASDTAAAAQEPTSSNGVSSYPSGHDSRAVGAFLHWEDLSDAERVAWGEEREQEQLLVQERAHNREQRERIVEERVSNLEEAVAALVAYVQRQQAQQEERLAALQAAGKEQAERHATGLEELKQAIALLTSQVASESASAKQASGKEEEKEAGIHEHE